MNAPLFPLLWLLTVLDLAFVQATGIVAFADLLPLWALAGGAFALRRLQRFDLYRALWNIGVVAVFALLVHHATTTGLLHMLEDGLLLAVLCQVHLLNNVGDRQRPDLVFFNTFLITFVTSFFSTGVAWSLLFVAHAFALVPALQLHSLLGRTSNGSVDGGVVRTLLRASLPQTGAIVALTALVFVAWPRDFRRQGWLGDALSSHGEAGLAEHVRLDDDRPVQLGNDVIARFTAISGNADDVPTHWRALVFDRFEQGGWLPQDLGDGGRVPSDPAWQRAPDGSFARDGAAPGDVSVHVQLLGGDRFRLPLPLGALAMRPVRTPGAHLEPTAFGGFLARRVDGAPGELTYDVRIAEAAPRCRPSASTRRRFLGEAEPLQSGPLRSLAAQLREDPRIADTAIERARATASWLEQNRRYQLPGGPGFAHNLDDFLLGSGAGHCEYFATALALLLRAQDVPCRLVGGLLVSEIEPGTATRVARSKHAHAWVEVLDEAGAWHTFDATPAADVLAATAGGDEHEPGAWATLQRWWAKVTGFDQEARARWLHALDPRTGTGAALLLSLALALWLAYRRRARSVLPAVRALRDALRQARLAPVPGETPRELVLRAADAGLDPLRLDRLRAAVAAHEHARYALRPRASP